VFSLEDTRITTDIMGMISLLCYHDIIHVLVSCDFRNLRLSEHEIIM